MRELANKSGGKALGLFCVARSFGESACKQTSTLNEGGKWLCPGALTHGKVQVEMVTENSFLRSKDLGGMARNGGDHRCSWSVLVTRVGMVSDPSFWTATWPFIMYIHRSEE